MSLRDVFAAAPLAEPRPLDLPGGVRVYVRPLSYAVLVNLRAVETADGRIPNEAVPAIVANALCDDRGELLFSEDSPQDLDVIGAKPLPVLKAIVDAALDASSADVGAAKKNSAETPC